MGDLCRHYITLDPLISGERLVEFGVDSRLTLGAIRTLVEHFESPLRCWDTLDPPTLGGGNHYGRQWGLVPSVR